MDKNKIAPPGTPKSLGPTTQPYGTVYRPPAQGARPGLTPKKPGLPSKAVESQPIGDASKASFIQPSLEQLLDNGFTPQESSLMHDALRIADMKWFDGDGCILGKGDQMELALRAGASDRQRWAVMAVPIYDMNAPGAVEIALHFLAESFDMAHVLDFQYQIAINMEAERLEFLMNIPFQHLTASQIGEIIGTFTKAMMESLNQELSALLDKVDPKKA
ncbi:MAG: hypothetical protein QE278_09180 [Limnobacter sp.]|nr:hypothetical protein [Limnobacter sp.]